MISNLLLADIFCCASTVGRVTLLVPRQSLPSEPMKPFRVTFELDQPVIAPFGVALDGLLAYARVREGSEAETAHVSLPLDQIDGVYQASELMFVGPAPIAKVNYVRSLKPEVWSRDAFKFKRGGTITKVTSRDELKNLIDEYEALASPAAFAWGVGDIEEIGRLLNFIDAVGKKAVSRFSGQLRSISIEEVSDAPNTYGFLDPKRLPLRTIPAELYNNIGGSSDARFTHARPHLPRWATEDEFCAVVDRRVRRLGEITW